MFLGIDIKKNEAQDKIFVTAPYHPEFPSKAKMLGGKYDGDYWTFSALDEGRVRDLLTNIFGTDGEPVQVVTVQVDASRVKTNQSELWALGRLIVARYARDFRVKLGKDVVLVSGQFARSGGSAKYPEIGPNDAVLEVRNVPVALAMKAQGENPDAFKIVDRVNVQEKSVMANYSTMALIGELVDRGINEQALIDLFKKAVAHKNGGQNDSNDSSDL